MTKKSFLKHVRIYFREYCNHTSVHGFQYFGEKKRHIFERIWWFIIFVICLAGCITSIYAVYKKWESSPVIVNFANKETPVYEIPFPAVTICPEAKSDQTIFNFTQIMQKMEDNIPLNLSEEVNFEYMSQICNYYPELNYTNNDTFSEEFYHFLEAVTPKFQIINCSFVDGLREYCEWFFVPIITEEGICYTFNMMSREEIYRDTVIFFKNYHRESNFSLLFGSNWNLQDGYGENAGLSPFPLRAYLAGAQNGLEITFLTPNQDLDYACKDSLQGYRVLLHSPMTIPRPSQKYFRVPLDQSVIGAIEPAIISTSTMVKTYNPERRKCFFSSERQLRYFKNYTSSNCNLECLTNYTLTSCDCVDFYMPRENGTNICGTGRIECMKEAEEMMHINYLRAKIKEKNTTKRYDECNCLPVCSDLTYTVETSQIDYEWRKLISARRSLPRINDKSHLSTLTLFFKGESFITSERNELYGPIDFLANFGGLLGLFTGFSILSLMEFFYFLSIRIVCNKRLFGQWSGDEND